MPRNPYEVLGLPKSCTEEQIRKKYRKLAMRYHPDRNPPGDKDAAFFYDLVHKAYEILRDPARRKVYDETGETGDGEIDLLPKLTPLVGPCVLDALKRMNNDGMGVLYINFLSCLRTEIMHRVNKNKEARAMVEIDIARMKEIRKRLIRPEEKLPLIECSIDGEITRAQEMMSKIEMTIKAAAEALAYIEVYTYMTEVGEVDIYGRRPKPQVKITGDADERRPRGRKALQAKPGEVKVTKTRGQAAEEI